MANEATNKKAFEVLKIDELTRIGDANSIEKYYRFRIKTQGGTVLSVDVDQDDYTHEDKVKQILTDKATHADRLKTL